MRGSFRIQRLRDRFQHAVHICHHVIIPDPQYPIIVFAQPAVAHDVFCVALMLPAVKFNDQSLLAAEEIDNVTAERFLPNEFMAVNGARTHAIPES